MAAHLMRGGGGAISPDEAAAIAAAIERFESDTAPPPADSEAQQDRWRREAILEGVSREERFDAPHPWINT